jgi:glutaconate CoA-transferase subunit A
LYGFDIKHFKQYGELLTDGGYSAWAEAFLGDSESSYQSAVGGLEAIQSLPLPVY